MKSLWLTLMAATMAFMPVTMAVAQDKGAVAGQSAQAADADDGDDDGDDDAAAGASKPADDDDDAARGSGASADMVPPATGLKIPKGSELMPASALNGDQLGLPPKSLSSQIITPLKLGAGGNDFAVSAHDFYLRAGQAYRWDIASEADIEYKFNAPDFFRNVWMNQIVISDLEVHMAGPPAWLEYDSQGPITIQFQTIRPGRYDWHVEGLEGARDMKGTITVVP